MWGLAKHVCWGSTKIEPSLRQILDWMADNNMTFINVKEHSHLCGNTGRTDTLDLTNGTPFMLSICQAWKVDDNKLDSDHFPITFTLAIEKSRKEMGNNQGKSIEIEGLIK